MKMKRYIAITLSKVMRMKLTNQLITAVFSFVICCSLLPIGIHATEIVETPKFDNVSDYNDFILQLREEPLDFVSLTMLDGLGAFYYFHADSFTKPQYYSYTFIDDNDFTFGIQIFHEKYRLNSNDIPIIEAPQNIENMLYIDTEEARCIVVKNGVNYFYSSGCLRSMSWSVGNVEFMMSDGASEEYWYCNYPLGQERTFLSQMLSGNDTEAAFAITKLRIQILWGWIQPFVIAVVLIIAACVLVAFLIKKRRKVMHIPAVNNTSD